MLGIRFLFVEAQFRYSFILITLAYYAMMRQTVTISERNTIIMDKPIGDEGFSIIDMQSIPLFDKTLSFPEYLAILHVTACEEAELNGETVYLYSVDKYSVISKTEYNSLVSSNL